MSLLSPLSGRVRHARTTRVTLSSLLLSLTLMGASLASPSAVAQNDYGLPDLGSASGGISSNDEYRIGRAWLRQFRAHVREWDDPITLDWINGIVRKLAPWSELDRNDFIITLVASSQLNAFAVPGGVVGVNTGLFAFAPDRDAFASVLAHELGHLSQHHFARNMERQAETRLPTLAGFLAGMVIAAGGGGSAGLATMAGTQAAAISDQLAYSRRFEQEADRVGIEALARAGFDPEAMPRMFRAMQRMASLQGSNAPEFLLTHPVTEARIGDTQARADALETATPDPLGTLAYEMIRARALLALNLSQPSQGLVTLREDSADPDAIAYYQALAAAENHEIDSALAALDRLHDKHPDLTLISASAIEVARDARRYDEATQRARRLLRLQPDYLPTRLALAEVRLQQDPASARQQLEDMRREHPDDPKVWNLAAEASGRSGHQAEAFLYRAEFEQLEGRMDSAFAQLKLADEAARKADDFALANRINARREDFKDYRNAIEAF
ncbi:tetratricopeptide repeat protein [Cobetia marina]|uniref:M48 family metalloprotease n=1 Tax=Cobetia TaxID=204286 RepID=UPI0010AE8DC4|nr:MULTISPECIES: M48 family metalloprotease [Cobetia]MDH2292819.1 M48 family metalloprotease [Cobetia sp. 10Alg 146]TKD60553.1 tetratricopeptide repeat protein [Cobetia marina]GED43652.1 putative beta-barrel assembly-enhancing protease [Cobetia marina]